MRLDAVARRVALYAGAALAVIALTSLTIKAAQKDIIAKLDSTEQEVRAIREVFHRSLEVQELAVVALVDPDSTERMGAILELRRRRHVTPIDATALTKETP